LTFQIADLNAQIDDMLSLCNEIALDHLSLACFYPGDKYVNDVNSFSNLTHPSGVGFELYAKLLLEAELDRK